MAWSLAFDPLVPLWAIAVLAGCAVLLALVLIVRRVRGAALRSVTMAAVLLALANPVLTREDREPLDSTVAVIVDRSDSQTISGRTEDAMAAGDRVMALLDRLPGINGVRVDVGRGAGEDGGTELFAGLDRALENVPTEQVAGAIMITDGLVHDVPDTAARLGFDAPLHALITGADDERDRRIALTRAPRFGIVGQEQEIALRVEDAGIEETGAPVTVTVARDGEVIDVLEATVGETLTVPVEITHGGENVLTFDAEVAEGEITVLNNQAVLSVEGIRENLRVLLVSGEPHAGERTWRNLLKSDAAVDLVHFTILRPPEKQDGTPINQLSLIAFPTRELFSEKIEDFDLIIFDRYQRRGVLPAIYFDNISSYVKNGGAVLIASGPDYATGRSLYRTALSDILPAVPTGETIAQPYRAALTTTGERHPVTRGLPGAESDPPAWSPWFRLVEADHLSGSILMSGPGERPLLILDRQDEGRVALMLSDHAWLWARGYDGGGPHVPLLRRLSHWLMKEPDLEEERLIIRRAGASLVVERRTMETSVPDAVVTAPDGSTEVLSLTESDVGVWRGRMPLSGFGLYRAENGALSAMSSVGPANPREFEAVISTDERLKPVVEAMGGAVSRIDGAEVPRIIPIRGASNYAGRDWIGIRDTGAYVVTGLSTFPLFAGFAGLAILLGAFAATWYREGR